MLHGWFKLHPSCRRCGLLFDRGAHDYFIGAYLVNLIASELIFAIGLGVWLLNTWPNIPWDTLQWAAITIMIRYIDACALSYIKMFVCIFFLNIIMWIRNIVLKHVSEHQAVFTW